jgi:hypothetical protein
MTFAASLNHVKLLFVEMPRLELTLGQAVRLWGLGADDCRYVIDALVDEGFLRWTPKRTVARNRRSSQMASRRQSPYTSVQRVSNYDKHVGPA